MDTPLALSIWKRSEHSASALEMQRLVRRCADHLDDDEFALRYEFALDVVTAAFRAMDRRLAGDREDGALPAREATARLLDLAIGIISGLFAKAPAH